MNNMEAPENFIPDEKDKNVDGKKKKKMEVIIIAIVAVIIAAVILTVVAVKSKNRSEDFDESIPAETAGDEISENDTVFEPVSLNDDVEVTFESSVSSEFAEEVEAHQLETAATTAYKPEVSQVTAAVAQPTTKKNQVTTTQYLETTTVKTDTAADADNNVLAQIRSFFNGKYYFDGSMISGGTQAPTEMAMDGNNFQVYTEMEGLDIAVMNMDDTMYLMNPEKKTYIEINAALKSLMGVDDDAFSFEFNKIKFDSDSPTSVTEATYMGKSAICYTYKDSENCIEFITVGNEIKQITQYSSSSEAKTILQADEFSAEIPDDMLTFKGYSKTNMISFMKDFM